MLITVHPEIIDQAKQAGFIDRAFWLWQFLKHICRAGGTIPEQAVKDALKATGYSKSSCCDWLNDAVRIGLLSLEVSERTGLVYYRLVSWAEGAFIAGCKRLGNAVTVELDKFISRSWKPEVYTGRLLQLRGRDEKIARIKRDENTGKAVLTVLERKAKPISRNALTALTGVSRSTQKRREKTAGVVQVENVLIIQDEVTGYKPNGYDSEHPELCVNNGALLERLPNSKAIPQRIKLSNSNSSKRANKRLKALCKSDAIAKGETFPRMYADSFDHAMALHQDGLIYPTREIAPGVQAWQRMKQHASI